MDLVIRSVESAIVIKDTSENGVKIPAMSTIMAKIAPKSVDAKMVERVITSLASVSVRPVGQGHCKTIHLNSMPKNFKLKLFFFFQGVTNVVPMASTASSANPNADARMMANATRKQVNVNVLSDGRALCVPIDVQPDFLVSSVVSIVSVTTGLVATTKLVTVSVRLALRATSVWNRVRTQSSG
jgi:hypothetical protein